MALSAVEGDAVDHAGARQEHGQVRKTNEKMLA